MAGPSTDDLDLGGHLFTNVGSVNGVQVETLQSESEKGQPNGYAGLDATGLVPLAQLPPLGGGGPAGQLDANGTTLDVNAIADGDVLRRSGTAVVGQTCTAAGAALLDDTDAAAQRTTLGLGTAAVEAASAFEAAGAVATHAAAADPHAGYQLESEKAQANGYASLDSGGKVPTAQLPAGSTNPTTVVSLDADALPNATTVGIEILGLKATGLVAGRYVFQYFLRVQSSATATGVKLGVNYSGTAAPLVATMRNVGTGTSAVTGTADGNNTAAQIVEGRSARAESTTAPNLGPSLGHDTANADVLYVIEGILIASDGGDLELWHASETAAATTVKAGSALVLTKTD